MQDKIKLIMEKQESSKNDEEMEKYIIKSAQFKKIFREIQKK